MALRVAGAAFRLRPPDVDTLRARLPPGSPAWRGLDAVLLEYVLLPLLGIAPAELTYRVGAAATAAVDAGEAAAGVLLRPAGLEAGVVTLAVTASGLTVVGIAAPFWGFLAGALVYLILSVTARRRGA